MLRSYSVGVLCCAEKTRKDRRSASAPARLGGLADHCSSFLALFFAVFVFFRSILIVAGLSQLCHQLSFRPGSGDRLPPRKQKPWVSRGGCRRSFFADRIAVRGFYRLRQAIGSFRGAERRQLYSGRGSCGRAVFFSPLRPLRPSQAPPPIG